MSKINLNNVHENYNIQVEGDISPISKVDVDIVREFIKSLELIDNPSVLKLKQILKGYKCKKDVDVLDKIVEFNIKEGNKTVDRVDDDEQEEDEEYGDQSNKDKWTLDFIEIQGDLFKASWINSVTRTSGYNYLKTMETYEIVLNKDVKENGPYANTTFPFRSEEARDLAFDQIKDKMRNMKNIRFL